MFQFFLRFSLLAAVVCISLDSSLESSLESSIESSLESSVDSGDQSIIINDAPTSSSSSSITLTDTVTDTDTETVGEDASMEDASMEASAEHDNQGDGNVVTVEDEEEDTEDTEDVEDEVEVVVEEETTEETAEVVVTAIKSVTTTLSSPVALTETEQTQVKDVYCAEVQTSTGLSATEVTCGMEELAATTTSSSSSARRLLQTDTSVTYVLSAWASAESQATMTEVDAASFLDSVKTKAQTATGRTDFGVEVTPDVEVVNPTADAEDGVDNEDEEVVDGPFSGAVPAYSAPLATVLAGAMLLLL